MTSNATCASPTTATSGTVTMVINPNVTPSVSIATSTNNVCAGTSITITASPTNGGASPAYNFKVNGTTVQNTTSNTYTSSSFANNDAVTCVMTSNATCASPLTATSGSVTIQISASVTPAVSISPSTNNVCAGTSITVTATPNNGGASPTYDFKVNGTTVQNTTSNTYTSSSFANNDAVTCVMTSNASCASPLTATSGSVTIQISASVSPSVSISASTNNVCAGTSVTITATPTNGGASPTYDFKVNGTTVQNTTSNTYTSSVFSNGNNVSCIMTSNASCLSTSSATSNSIIMSVSSCTTTVLPNDNICQAITLSLTGYNSGNFSMNGVVNPNLGSLQGNSSAATFQPGESAPSSLCSGVNNTPKSLWYKFYGPQCGGVSLKVSTLNPYTAFNTILSAYTNPSGDCNQTISLVACNDNDPLATPTGQSTLNFAPGSLVPGQLYWIQVVGVGTSGGAFQLDIDGDVPNLTINSVTYGTIDVNIPSPSSAITNQYATRLRSRVQGNTGYTDQYVTGLSSKILNYLTSGTTYDIWTLHDCGSVASNERYFSAKTSTTTLTGCTGSNIASGPSITPVTNHCSLVTISWPALPAAQTTAAAYRVYWRQTAPTLQAGYCMATVNGTSLTLTFSNNLIPGATYNFWYSVICTGGAMATSPITPYTACSGAAKPQGDTDNQADEVYEKDGVYYVNMPFNYLNIPIPQNMESGKVYTVKLNEVNNTEYFDINRQSATIATEQGLMHLLPNPAKSAVIIRYMLPTVSDKLTIRILNIQGKELYSKVLDHPNQIGDESINVSELPNGIYLTNLQSNGFSITQKLVIEK